MREPRASAKRWRPGRGGCSTAALALLIAAPWLGMLPTPAAGQQTPPPATPPASEQQAPAPPAAEQDTDQVTLPGPDELRQRAEAAQANAELSDEAKASVRDLYEQAAAAMEQAEKHRADAARFQARATSSPQRVEEIRAQIAGMQPVAEAALAAEASSMTSSELDQRRSRSDAELAAARSTLDELRSQLETLRQRPEQIAAQLAEARKALEQIRSELSEGAVEGEAKPVSTARRAALLAKQHRRTLEIASYERESATFDPRLALRSAEVDLATREASRLEAGARVWQRLVQDRRQRDARATAEEAATREAQTQDMPAPVQALARENTELANQVQRETARERQLTAQLERTKADLEQLEADFERAQERVELGGLNEAVGILLREQRERLPSLRSYRAAASERRRQLTEISVAKIDVEDRRRKHTDLTSSTGAVVEQFDADLPEPLRAAATRTAEELVKERDDLLRTSSLMYDRIMRVLGELDTTERQLVTHAEEFSRYIRRHLLWIRSVLPVGPASARRTVEGAQWLMQPGHWTNLGRLMITAIGNAPLTWILATIVFALLRWGRRIGRFRLLSFASKVGRIKTDSIGLTLRGLGWSIVRAAPVPFALVFLGWQWYAAASPEDDFTRAFGKAILEIGLYWGLLALVRTLCASYGLMKVHFGWREQLRVEIYRVLPWWLAVVVPAVFIVVLGHNIADETLLTSLARVVFCVGMMISSVIIFWLLRPPGALMQELARLRPDSWVTRLRLVWYVLVGAAPLVLTVLAALGYFFTAVSLQMRMEATLWLSLALFLVYLTAMRWLKVTHRRLAYDAAVERLRAQRAADQESASADASAGEGFGAIEVEHEVDLNRATESSRRLIGSIFGFVFLVLLWMLWSDVLPALSVLDEVPLWQSTIVVDGVPTTAPITLANVLFGMLVLVITLLAARHLPGTLEIVLISRLPLDAGARYASTTLCRYIIVAVGFITAFNVLGMSWSSIQWLVAALSVGLGFGLQEIVANFISGIIILFERPFRVGDIVTVGDINGRVARIQIRATTIWDWDRRELVVPNKRFITSEFINSTLSDPIGRIRIPVGIAYGSNVSYAKELLLAAAEANDQVIADPAPAALFLGFGDSALNVELRCFVADVNNRLSITDQLNVDIEKRLKDAGIQIVFPQRDVHLYGTGPLDVRVIDRGGVDLDRGMEGVGAAPAPDR